MDYTPVEHTVEAASREDTSLSRGYLERRSYPAMLLLASWQPVPRSLIRFVHVDITESRRRIRGNLALLSFSPLPLFTRRFLSNRIEFDILFDSLSLGSIISSVQSFLSLLLPLTFYANHLSIYWKHRKFRYSGNFYIFNNSTRFLFFFFLEQSRTIGFLKNLYRNCV